VRAGTQGHGGKVSARVFPELLGPGSRCARPGHESDGIRATGIWSPDSLAALAPRNDLPSGTWRGCHQLVAVGHPLPVIRFFQREAFDDGFVAEPLAQPVDGLFGLGGAAIEQVGEIRSLAIIER
jgi:hypothetical protein